MIFEVADVVMRTSRSPHVTHYSVDVSTSVVPTHRGKPAYNSCRLKLTASVFNRLQPVYASSSGCRERCYAELAVSSPAVAEPSPNLWRTTPNNFLVRN